MSSLVIEGGVPLSGTICLQGSKNAVLPILAATLLNKDKSVIHNCPKLEDVSCAFDILKELGCEVEYDNYTAVINTKTANGCCISEELMKKMRSSIMFAGSMLSRFGKVAVTKPGGCVIGSRPIDIHIDAFRSMGASINKEDELCEISAPVISPCKIKLRFPSVGATENIMLASAIGKGKTVILNAAREPEIVDLANFLNKMGARVKGAGTNKIEIMRVKTLHSAEHTVIPDRIVCATYLCGAAATGGRVTVVNCIPKHLSSVIKSLKKMGCTVKTGSNYIYLHGNKLKPIKIKTAPYPGFPTDAQPLLCVCMCLANGTSYAVDTVFPERFGYINELIKMGAVISQSKKGIEIKGVSGLRGRNLNTKELRGGAALVLAGLSANGTTEIDTTEYIDRGYENIKEAFCGLGGVINEKAKENKRN